MSASPPEPRTWTRKDLRHTSAVVLIPPPSSWRDVQAVRASRDKSYLRWMPHVNLLYPFVEDDEAGENFARAARVAREALASHAPFPCALSRRARFFEHRGSVTAWRAPEDVDAIASSAPEASSAEASSAPYSSARVAALQAALESAFPFADDLGAIGGDGFVPHLSVGQWRAVADADAFFAEALPTTDGEFPRPDAFHADAVYLISRPSDVAPFRIRARVPLGGGEPTLLPVAPGGDKDGGGEWWTRAYRPPPPPPGAKCLEPKPKRSPRRGARRRPRGAKREWPQTTN